jgi:hypothetical protein
VNWIISAAKNFHEETFCYVQSQITLTGMTKYLDNKKKMLHEKRQEQQTLVNTVTKHGE